MKGLVFVTLFVLATAAAQAQTRGQAFNGVAPPTLGLTIAGTGPQTAGVTGPACPNEFGCEGVEEFFTAIGGDCVTDPEQGIFCTGPEGPEVPGRE